MIFNGLLMKQTLNKNTKNKITQAKQGLSQYGCIVE